MIILKQGDLMQAPEDIIAHGVNCRGVMGSGVARLIKEQYPKAYYAYMDKADWEGWRTGEMQVVLAPNGKWIANCATQDAYLPRGVCHADYDGIRDAMETLKSFAKAKGLSIAMPKIGAGLAGGDWNKIQAILAEVFNDYNVTVYYL